MADFEEFLNGLKKVFDPFGALSGINRGGPSLPTGITTPVGGKSSFTYPQYGDAPRPQPKNPITGNVSPTGGRLGGSVNLNTFNAATAPPQGADYSDIMSLINALGPGGYDAAGARREINQAYRPALGGIDKLMGQNKKKNAKDVAEVLKIYQLLSGDYSATGKKTGVRYDQQRQTTKSQYDGSEADVNARYDDQIAKMTAELTKLGQNHLIEAETNKLNTQRNRVLDNLAQSETTRVASNDSSKNALMSYYDNGAVGAKLQGADNASALKAILQQTLGKLSSEKANLLAQRSGDYSKSYQSYQSSIGDANKAKLDALFKLNATQREDALATKKLTDSGDSASAPMGQKNPFQYANNYFDSVLPPQSNPQGNGRAKQIFSDFVNSHGDLVNGSYEVNVGGTPKRVAMTAARAAQIASEYIANKGLNSQEAALLLKAVQQSYK